MAPSARSYAPPCKMAPKWKKWRENRRLAAVHAGPKLASPTENSLPALSQTDPFPLCVILSGSRLFDAGRGNNAKKRIRAKRSHHRLRAVAADGHRAGLGHTCARLDRHRIGPQLVRCARSAPHTRTSPRAVDAAHGQFRPRLLCDFRDPRCAPCGSLRAAPMGRAASLGAAGGARGTPGSAALRHLGARGYLQHWNGDSGRGYYVTSAIRGARRAGRCEPSRAAGRRALGRPARPAARPAALPSGTWVPGAICSTGTAIPAEVTM